MREFLSELDRFIEVKIANATSQGGSDLRMTRTWVESSRERLEKIAENIDARLRGEL